MEMDLEKLRAAKGDLMHMDKQALIGAILRAFPACSYKKLNQLTHAELRDTYMMAVARHRASSPEHRPDAG